MNNSLIILLCSLLLLNSSCGMVRINKLRKAALEDSPKMFVVTQDTQTVVISDSKTLKEYPDAILAKQDGHAYTRMYENKELLRLMKGDLNLYYQFNTTIVTEYSYGISQPPPHGTGYRDYGNPSNYTSRKVVRADRYFDLGLQSEPMLLTRHSLAPFVSDCPSCNSMLLKYDRVEKQNKIWKYINWTATAGSLVIAFTSDAADMSDLEVASFGGLFFGSIISGVFRHRAKGYNTWRLEDVIGEYNRHR